MLGYSTLKILVNENIWLPLSMILVNVSIYSILFFIHIGEIHPYAIVLLSYLSKFIILNFVMILLVLVALFVYLNAVSYVEILKRKSNLKKIFGLHFVLRSIVFVFGITLLFQMLPPFTEHVSLLMKEPTYLENVNGYQTVQYIEHQVSMEDSFQQVKVISDGLQKQGAIGVEYSFSESDEEYLPYLIVNEKYLETYPVLNGQHQQITLSSLKPSEKEILFIPKELYEKKYDMLIKQFPADTYTYQIIADSQKHFIFDKHAIADEIGYVQDSLVVLSDFINTSNLYIKDVDVDALNQYIVENGFPEGIGFIV